MAGIPCWEGGWRSQSAGLLNAPHGTRRARTAVLAAMLALAPVGEGRRPRGAYEANWVTRDGRLVIDDPEIKRRLVKTIDSYTAIYRKGCTPPNSAAWADIDNNKAFLAQTVVMTAKRVALNSQRTEGRAS